MKTEDYPLGSKAHIAALEKLLESSTDAMEELISFVPGPDVAKKDTDILYDTKDIQDKIGALVVSLSLAGYSSYVPKTEEEYIDEHIGMAEDMEKRMDNVIYLEQWEHTDPALGLDTPFFAIRKNHVRHRLASHTRAMPEHSYLIKSYVVALHSLHAIMDSLTLSGEDSLVIKTTQSSRYVYIKDVRVARACYFDPSYSLTHAQIVSISNLKLLLGTLFEFTQ